MLTINQVKNLDIGYLRRQGLIVPNRITEGKFSYNDGSMFGFSCDATKEDWYFSLKFILQFSDGSKREVNQAVYIIRRASNLGIGEVWWFGCPISGNAVKRLYFDYCKYEFISKVCFGTKRKKLYYPLQTVSGLSKLLMQEEKYQNYLDADIQKREQYFYNGNLTRRTLRTDNVRMKLDIVCGHLLEGALKCIY